LIRTAAPVELVPDAVNYLKSRKLWPLPPGCTLKAHPQVEYWEPGDVATCIGTYAALIAEVRDVRGELVTVHVTYFENGRKVAGRTPRKILSPTRGHDGCAVRLVPCEGSVLGVAEGIETALAAMQMLQVPVWACLNTSLLSTFEPPAGIDRLLVCADRDTAGLTAAWKLRDRLGLDMDLRLPRRGDWAEDLEGI
jgi:putative DNA primase/helicase